MSVHKCEYLMHAKSRSYLKTCCFTSPWQILDFFFFMHFLFCMCVFVPAAPTACVNHRCCFWMSFTGRWGPFWFNHQGEAHEGYHTHTHRRKRNFLFIPHFRTSKMYTLAGCSRTNKDSGRYVLTSAHSSTAASLPRMSANTSILIKSSETERGREGGRRRVQPVGKEDVKGRNRQMARGKVEFVLARYAQKWWLDEGEMGGRRGDGWEGVSDRRRWVSGQGAAGLSRAVEKVQTACGLPWPAHLGVLVIGT